MRNLLVLGGVSWWADVSEPTVDVWTGLVRLGQIR